MAKMKEYLIESLMSRMCRVEVKTNSSGVLAKLRAQNFVKSIVTFLLVFTSPFSFKISMHKSFIAFIFEFRQFINLIWSGELLTAQGTKKIPRPGCHSIFASFETATGGILTSRECY